MLVIPVAIAARVSDALKLAAEPMGFMLLVGLVPCLAWQDGKIAYVTDWEVAALLLAGPVGFAPVEVFALASGEAVSFHVFRPQWIQVS